MDGVIWDATVQTSTGESSAKQSVVVLSNDEVLTPADADFGEFTIVEATAEERETLKQAGFAMADWTPAPEGSSCGGCHANLFDGEGQLQGSAEQSQP
jgi:hypothetical protein